MAWSWVVILRFHDAWLSRAERVGNDFLDGVLFLGDVASWVWIFVYGVDEGRSWKGLF